MIVNVQRCTSVYIAAALLLMVASCTHDPVADPVIIYQPKEVKVPFEVKRECSPKVCHAFQATAKLPVFAEDPAKPGVVTLDKDNQNRLRVLLLDLKAWGNGLLTFTTSP